METTCTSSRLEPLTRYRLRDGSEMDMSSNLPRLTPRSGQPFPGDVTGLFRPLAYARTLFERAGPTFLFKERPKPSQPGHPPRPRCAAYRRAPEHGSGQSNDSLKTTGNGTALRPVRYI